MEWANTHPPNVCKGCRANSAKRDPPEKPPCGDCSRVDLWPENAAAARIYMLVRGQVITQGDGQVTDLNHLATWKAIDEYGIQRSERVKVFEAVQKVFHYFLK